MPSAQGGRPVVPVTLPGKLEAGLFIPNAPAPNSDLVTWVLELPLEPGLPARLSVQWPRFTFGSTPLELARPVVCSTDLLRAALFSTTLCPVLAEHFHLYIATNPDSRNQPDNQIAL